MKPRVLKIKGLNSFETEQIIDFNSLTEKGLFGIFGPTGSGKSTILDAITIALYGKITRTNKGFINTTTKDLNVSYEFEIGVGEERKIYLAERNIKVNKNDRYNTKYARLIEKNSDNEKVIAEGPTELQNEIHKIIGLTADDFTRSVVLPQGKFSEFLKLGGREKRNMLERIFALEKYGQSLVEKIKRVRNANLKEENILMGELKKYEDLAEEDFKQKEEKLKKLLQEQEVLKDKKKQMDEDYEKYKEVWELQKELNEFIKKQLILDEKLENINLKRENLRRGQSALKVKPFIDEVEKTYNEIQENEKKLQQTKIDLKEIDDKLITTEEAYNNSQKEKDEVIPVLIKEESDFARAIEINKKISELEIETQELRDEYKKVKYEKDKITEKLNLLISNREKLINEINHIESRLNDVKIDPEYREKLQYALEKENDYKKSLENKRELDNKISQKEDDLKKISNEYEIVLQEKNIQNSIVKELEEKSKYLRENNPGDNSLLLEKSQSLNNITKKVEEALSNNNRKQELEEVLKAISNKKTPIEERLNYLKNKLNTNKELLIKIDDEIEHIKENNLASLLSNKLVEGEPCPVCGSVHHTNVALPIDKNQILENQEQRKKVQDEIEALNNDITNLSIEFVSIEKEEEHIVNEYNLVLEKLKDVDLNKITEKKAEQEYEFKELKEKIDKYNDDKNNIEVKLENEKEKKSKIDLKETRLSENVKNETIIIKELKNDLLKENKKLQELSKEYSMLKQELNVEDISLKMKDIIKFEKESEELKSKEKNIRVNIEKCDNNKQVLIEKQSNLDIQLSKIQQSGTEKAKNIKENKEEVKKLCGEKNPEEYLELIKNRIKEISETNNKLKNELDKENKIKELIYNEKLSLEKAEKIFNERRDEQQGKLKNSLIENSFEDISEVKKYLLDENTLLNVEKEINSFDDDVKNIKNNIIRIEKKLNGNKIDDSQWEELNKNRVEIESFIATNLREIATLQKIIEDFKEDLENLKMLRKKERELEHKLSLLNDLMKLVEGNKFVEFVAMNQLKYIAREASKRLKDITRDRYALEIDAEGNFTIRDDFNGGQIREASTLSGGETFLTSLSLALALSSQVQLKGSAPLEFFFLDEGFGTLDTDLLDVVMSSLEKLHSSRLSVGIISHVEELKNRVPIKLIVHPASPGEGGSKVRLEYS